MSTGSPHDAPGASNLTQALQILRRRGLWVPLCMALAGVVAFGISKHQPVRYTATASLLFKSTELSQQVTGLTSDIGVQAEQSNDLKLVQFSDVASATASKLAGGLSARAVEESVSVAQQGESSLAGESSVVTVSALASSPNLAAAIANAYASEVIAQQHAASARYYATALTLVGKQLAAIPRDQRLGAAAVALQTRAQSLRLLSALQPSAVQLGRQALAPKSPSAPRTSRNVLIALALGLLASAGLIYLLELLDTRVRDAAELPTLYDAPLLGVLHEDRSLKLAGPGTLCSGAQDRSLGLVLARLRSFNAQRAPRTILLTSARSGDGTSTVALHLARAAAQRSLGVLLVEVNLRRPALASLLGLPPSPGLIDLLHGTASLAEATRSVTVGSVEQPRRFDLLIAGSGDPRGGPDGLLDSEAMSNLLRSASARYELVLIDAPPLSLVPDAFSLLAHTDGVLVVSALGHDRREQGEELRDVLARSGTPLLGVVANRLHSRAEGAYTEEEAQPVPADPAVPSHSTVQAGREPVEAGRVSAGA